MRMKTSFAPRILALAILLAAPVFAADQKAPPAKNEKDNYPLTTCLVSDEKLGSMGDYVTYVHKEAGKPDRVVRLCCDGCIDDFKADPKKFLAKLDTAAKGKAEPAKKSEPAKAHDHGSSHQE